MYKKTQCGFFLIFDYLCANSHFYLMNTLLLYRPGYSYRKNVNWHEMKNDFMALCARLCILRAKKVFD